MLVETAADNFFVNLFRIGVSLGVIGTLFLPTGMLLGIRLIRKEKYHSKLNHRFGFVALPCLGAVQKC